MESDYKRYISVVAPPEAVYTALTTGFDKWWTDSCDPVSRPGDCTTFRFDSTYWVMRALRLVPNSTVELECIEAHHMHPGLPSSILEEWAGTVLRWQICRQRDETTVTFTHRGLVPALECYGVCQQGWDYFFATSLKMFLDTGTGSPFRNSQAHGDPGR